MRNWIFVALFLSVLGQPGHAQQAGQFDLYVLALTWSPAYCATGARNNPANAAQCSSNAGFVIHGLWPQANAGPNPKNCERAERVTAENTLPVHSGRIRAPLNSDRLLNHEWSKHGTCSGLTQAEYFQKTADAAARLNVPPELEHLTVERGDDTDGIEKLFVAANPQLKPEQIVVKVDRYGRFYEVAVCMDKLLEFTTCRNTYEPPTGTPGIMLPNELPAFETEPPVIAR